jgi:sterol 14alpha-demethylase
MPCLQHGDVFTFILFGRRVTVALGAKGNNFILGGKSTSMSAEDAYKVGGIDWDLVNSYL